jgi:flagellar hook-associated protein 3 FlgL
MRMTFSMAYREGAIDIAQTSERLAAAQKQVSSGNRVNVASDDPVSAARIVDEQGSIARIDAYTSANDAASSRLNIADSVLSDVVERISYAQTLVTGAQGSTVTQAQRDAAIQGLSGIRDALVSDLNTKFDGAYLFSGTDSTDAPYTQASNGTVSAYRGNTSVASVDVDGTRQIQSTFDGSRIAQGSDSADIFTVLSNLTTAIANGDAAGMENGAAALGRAFDRATLAQTTVGNAMRTVDDAGERLAALRVDASARASKLQAADMAAAITAMTQAQTSYQAALAAFATLGKTSLMNYIS